jgi:hypothetical protein
VLASLARGTDAVSRAFAPYRSPKVFAVFRKDDLAPSFALLKSSVTFALGRRHGRGGVAVRRKMGIQH